MGGHKTNTEPKKTWLVWFFFFLELRNFIDVVIGDKPSFNWWNEESICGRSYSLEKWKIMINNVISNDENLKNYSSFETFMCYVVSKDLST